MFKSKRILSIVGSILIIAFPVVVFLQRQNITDWYRLQGYQPPAKIQEIVTDTTMNSYAKKLFYVNHPELDDKDSFNYNCQDGEEQSIILGCYINGEGIFIYNVSDPRLDGIHEVTGAHEMLHAAYDRLSSSEKANVNQLLNEEFAIITDQRIKNTLENYRTKDPSVLPNEMHSIFGTEVRNLSLKLEEYYKKYFTDRSKIVALAEHYEAEFTLREQQVEAYDRQLQDLRAQIDSIRVSVDVQTEEIRVSRVQMNNLLASKQYDEYNSRVPGFNSKVAALNSQVASANSLIDQFNVILNQRNEIALQQQGLVQAIDSRLNTVSPQ